MTVQNKPSLANDALMVGRGLLMGAADIVPGVSGGTVALILGIYKRLVTCVSRFDRTFVRHVIAFDLRQAAAHIDLRFLFTLGLGIGIGIVALAKLMTYLLSNVSTFPPTMAAFFGLIVASAILVAKQVRTWSVVGVVGLIAGAIFAFWLTGLAQLNPGEGGVSHAYLFMASSIAICAMILPGISGAFVLVVLGTYAEVTGIISNLSSLSPEEGDISKLFTTWLGCATGLLCFSKLLRWLLERHESVTMAIMVGFMVGSLRKVWPFKSNLAQVIESGDKVKNAELHNMIPAIDGAFWLALAIGVASAAAVLLLERFAGKSASSSSSSKSDCGSCNGVGASS